MVHNRSDYLGFSKPVPSLLFAPSKNRSNSTKKLTKTSESKLNEAINDLVILHNLWTIAKIIVYLFAVDF